MPARNPADEQRSVGSAPESGAAAFDVRVVAGAHPIDGASELRITVILPLVLVAVLAFLLGALLGLVAIPGALEQLARRLTPAAEAPARVGGPFSLVDHTGRRVTDRDFRGRHMLIALGYTRSPDVTPASLQTIAAALDRLGVRGERVTPILITLDPARDDPATLAGYVGRFHPRLVGLTGSEAEIVDVARAYHSLFHRESEPVRSQDYGIRHPALIYLMGPDGRFVTHFGPGTGVDTLVERLAKELL